MATDNDRELDAQELEEVAGGMAADANIYCPTTNSSGCNSNCKPPVKEASTT